MSHFMTDEVERTVCYHQSICGIVGKPGYIIQIAECAQFLRAAVDSRTAVGRAYTASYTADGTENRDIVGQRVQARRVCDVEAIREGDENFIIIAVALVEASADECAEIGQVVETEVEERAVVVQDGNVLCIKIRLGARDVRCLFQWLSGSLALPSNLV